MERFTLGEGHSQVVAASLWTPAAIACFRQRVKDYALLWIGVSSEAEYRAAAREGIDAVMVDSPRDAARWRERAASAAQPGHPPFASAGATAPAAR